VKILLGVGTTLSGRLLLYDALNMSFRELKLRKNPATPPITELIDYEQFCGIPPAQATEQAGQTEIPEITVAELKARMDAHQDFVLVDVRNPNEWEIGRIPGAHLIPLPQIENGDGVEQVRRLLNGSELIVHCKSGARSAKALKILQAAGIQGKNLRGGILAWAEAYDPSIPKY
jgi:Rhodanese-related sulfurtransferase